MRKGTEVEWNWGNGKGEGKIEQKFEKKVTRTIKGAHITRDASKENPAYLVKQENGGKALKKESELKKSS